MSAYSEEDWAKIEAMIKAHHQDYLESGGVRGHITASWVDPGHWSTMLLLRTVGRKSGIVRNTPLAYSTYDGQFVIVASKGGAHEHPHWYHNIKAGGEVAFQIATQAFIADWYEPTSIERPRVWAYLDTNVPVYATYRAATNRKIPLIFLKPKEEIPVFTP